MICFTKAAPGWASTGRTSYNAANRRSIAAKPVKIRTETPNSTKNRKMSRLVMKVVKIRLLYHLP